MQLQSRLYTRPLVVPPLRTYRPLNAGWLVWQGFAPDVLNLRFSRVDLKRPWDAHTRTPVSGLCSTSAIDLVGGAHMGWSFRRSLRFGPFRFNFSKSGIGYSIGGPGFRTGVRPCGRRYTRVGIPGTGVSYSTLHPRGVGVSKPTTTKAGCMFYLLIQLGLMGASILTRIV